MGPKSSRSCSATAIAATVLLLACSCSAALYRISSDELIEEDESPTTSSPGWQWPRQDQTPTRSRTNVFPNRVPSWASEPPSEFPEEWKMALRRAAFQTLRHEAGLLLGYPGITSTVQSEVYRELWYRLSVAEFEGMKEYQDYDEEEQRSDISTLAEGFLLDIDGDLQFYATRRKNCDCEGAKTLATWSIRRLRHSGPGRGGPQFQLRFSVVPKSDERVVDLVSVKVESTRPTPQSPSYRGIPIFKKSHNKEYNPDFINAYAQVISSYLQHRDNNPKYHPPSTEENKNKDRTPNRQQYTDYDSSGSSEEYSEPYSDYSKYSQQETPNDDDEEETSVEYDTQYREKQESSRRQYHQFYRQQYPSYRAPQTTQRPQYQHQQNYRGQSYRAPQTTQRPQYQHQQNYRGQTDSYRYYQSPPSQKEFRPSQPYQRYSESDPLFADNQRVDQKVLPQLILTQHEKISTLYQTTQKPTQNTPIVQFFHEYQQEKLKNKMIEDELYDFGSRKRNNHSSAFYQSDWTKRAIPEATKSRENYTNHSFLPTVSPSFIKDNDPNSYSKTEGSRFDTLEDKFPVGSKSLATLVSAVEAYEKSFHSKRSTSKHEKPYNESNETTVSNSNGASENVNSTR